MKKENLIVIAVIGGIILLGVGYSLGLSSGEKAIEEVKAPLAELLASKVIESLTTTASGEVTEIAGRNLTLSKEGDSLTISIREDAVLYREFPPKEEATKIPQPLPLEEIEFEEIKAGDQVNIFCVLKENGLLEGREVRILP